jgi:hypothetical protein
MPGPKPKPPGQKYKKRTITLPPDVEAYLRSWRDGTNISTHLAQLVRESDGFRRACPAPAIGSALPNRDGRCEDCLDAYDSMGGCGCTHG